MMGTRRTLQLGILVGGLVATASSAVAAELRVPEDYATIKQAAQAAEDGDTIRVAPGEYDERVTVRTPGITIVGTDAVLTRRLRVRADRVTIGGLQFRGRASRLVVRGGETVVDGNVFDGGRGLTIRGDSATVRQNVGSALRRRARFRVTGDDAVVTDNRVVGKPGRYRTRARRVHGIYFGNGGIDFPLSAGISVTGNDALVEGNTIQSADTGIFVRGAGATVRGCTVTSVATGFEIVGDNARVEANEVVSTERPVYDIGPEGFIVRGGGFDLRGDGHRVLSNVVRASAQSGIHVRGDAGLIRNDEIVVSGWTAVHIEGDDHADVDNEVIASDQAGFLVTGARYTVELNLVTYATYSGFAVAGARCIVRQNHVEFSEYQSFLVEGDESDVTDNVAVRSGYAGYRVMGDRVSVVANQSGSAGYAGFQTIGSDSVIEDNVAQTSRYSAFDTQGDRNSIDRNVSSQSGYFGFEVTGDDNSLTGNTPGAFDPRYADYGITGVGNTAQ